MAQDIPGAAGHFLMGLFPLSALEQQENKSYICKKISLLQIAVTYVAFPDTLPLKGFTASLAVTYKPVSLLSLPASLTASGTGQKIFLLGKTPMKKAWRHL